MHYYIEYESFIGKLTVVSDEKYIVGIWIEGQKYFCNTVKGKLIENKEIPILIKTKKWLDRYFSGEKVYCDELLLKPNGSEFRQLVWRILCEIPYGEITTYGEIAKKVAKIQNKEKMFARAIGSAVGHNPISIIIPCHRVIGSNGSLTGYAGGIDIKKKLLEFESNNCK